MLWRIIRTIKNWPVYFLQKFVGCVVTYRFRKGGVLKCGPRDRGALVDVWLECSYDPNVYGLPFDWSRCKRIIDIGAHIGSFTVFARQMAPQARIVAVEPDPYCFAMLKQNCVDEELINAAVGPENGETMLAVQVPGDGAGSTGSSSVVRDGYKVSVPMVGLSSLVRTQVDFLKMDCEGAEYESLYSLSDVECARICFLALEYHHFSNTPGHSPNVLTQWLAARGFDLQLHRKSMLLAWCKSAQKRAVA